MKSEGEMKRKPAKSKRKSTNVLSPFHPDLKPAIDSLTNDKLFKTDSEIIEAGYLDYYEYEALVYGWLEIR